MKVTYHDHCRLDDAPREILAAVPGSSLWKWSATAWMPDAAEPPAERKLKKP
ncbi:MAG: hypothetical protein NTY29_09500 [Proteobacteria bacterium]|nr:hypothetical protein [Pseudomonadota bacterium]